jgi:hypothetical protein
MQSEPPPQQGTIWLDGDKIWFTHPNHEILVNGRALRIPGGTISFPADVSGRTALLDILRRLRDLWAPGNEAERVRFAERFAKLK